MPAIGMGTFGSDRYDASDIAAAVRTGADLGYRLIDCASIYGNEAAIGSTLAEVFTRIPREEFFVMSKVWNDAHEPVAARASVLRSLEDLRLTHLDAVFVHWPFRNSHAPHADTDARDPHAVPYDHDAFMQTWHALEELVSEGVIGHLGTSNMTIPKLQLVLRDARIAPALNEMEAHPTFQQQELSQFCRDHGIQVVASSPLGSPSRPDRDRSDGDLVDLAQPVVRGLAEARGTHPAAICLKWAITRGQIPIPFAVKPEQLAANLAAANGTPLGAWEIEAMRSVERNNRLIKGQVFLWPSASSWRELWDVDGSIPGVNGYVR